MSEEKKEIPASDFDKRHRFVKGNSQAFGNGLPKDDKRGNPHPQKRIKRLTAYLRNLLEKNVEDFEGLDEYIEKHGKKPVAEFLMHRILETASKDPQKAHPLVRDILNRIDGVLTPEIEVDPDTPVTVVKFVVVGARPKVVEESEDEL